MTFYPTHKKRHYVSVIFSGALMMFSTLACCPDAPDLVGKWTDDGTQSSVTYKSDGTYTTTNFQGDGGNWTLTGCDCDGCFDCECTGCQVSLTTTNPGICDGDTGVYTMTISGDDYNEAEVTAGSDPNCPARRFALCGDTTPPNCDGASFTLQ